MAIHRRPTRVQAPAQPNTYQQADAIVATITDVAIGDRPVLSLTVVDEQGIAITGLQSSNLRFTIAKLLPGDNGSASAWQSYINRTKRPAITPENPSAIQATSESGGKLTDHGNGTYTYTFVTDIRSVTQPVSVPYEPLRTHRVAIQFSGGPVANPIFDWVPETGVTTNLSRRDIVATESCNSCHDPLALHGGGRIEVKYCVTCHNPGTVEPNSGTEMDFTVLIHKIHRGSGLPSVQAGGEYVVYGFGDSRHDYSHVKFPQDITNCTKCHAGTSTAGTASIAPATLITNQGDNWAQVPTMAACGSCHDDVGFEQHFGGQADDSGCQSCHSVTGAAGSIEHSHQNSILTAMTEFRVDILSVTNAAPGEKPGITFSVTNPKDKTAYNIFSDPKWSGARLVAGMAFSSSDFTNTGNGEVQPVYSQTNLLTASVANGDGTYSAILATPVPDGTKAPGRAATGSGMVTIEARARKDIGEDGRTNIQNIPVTQPHRFFSIDEPNGVVRPRRQVVSIDKCNNCHAVKSNHGGNRTNNPIACAGCHNPRNTDRSVRAIAVTPPSDGKQEESLDFKVMIHGIHASGYRQKPLQVVGFRGLSTHVFDDKEVQYPGKISNCSTCHIGNTYQLPLATSVLATTIDSGNNLSDPADDKMITPAAAVCSSCHDTSLARAHMEQNGGDFTATRSSIAAGVSTETCSVCHGPDRQASVLSVHRLE